MKARDGFETAGEGERPMLQVALAPAAIAFQVFDHVRRRLFVAAVQIFREMHFPARAAHQGGLDKIMAHRAPADRTPAGEFRQRAMLNERREPDDRVVSPEVALLLLPEIRAGGEDRAVE